MKKVIVFRVEDVLVKDFNKEDSHLYAVCDIRGPVLAAHPVMLLISICIRLFDKMNVFAVDAAFFL